MQASSQCAILILVCLACSASILCIDVSKYQSTDAAVPSSTGHSDGSYLEWLLSHIHEESDPSLPGADVGKGVRIAFTTPWHRAGWEFGLKAAQEDRVDILCPTWFAVESSKEGKFHVHVASEVTNGDVAEYAAGVAKTDAQLFARLDMSYVRFEKWLTVAPQNLWKNVRKGIVQPLLGHVESLLEEDQVQGFVLELPYAFNQFIGEFGPSVRMRQRLLFFVRTLAALLKHKGYGVAYVTAPYMAGPITSKYNLPSWREPAWFTAAELYNDLMLPGYVDYAVVMTYDFSFDREKQSYPGAPSFPIAWQADVAEELRLAASVAVQYGDEDGVRQVRPCLGADSNVKQFFKDSFADVAALDEAAATKRAAEDGMYFSFEGIVEYMRRRQAGELEEGEMPPPLTEDEIAQLNDIERDAIVEYLNIVHARVLASEPGVSLTSSQQSAVDDLLARTTIGIPIYLRGTPTERAAANLGPEEKDQVRTYTIGDVEQNLQTTPQEADVTPSMEYDAEVDEFIIRDVTLSIDDEGATLEQNLYVPTPHIIANRINLAREAGVGFAVWELGQAAPLYLNAFASRSAGHQEL